MDRDAAIALLKPLLEDEAVGKIGHDLKFDAIVLAQHGVTLRGFDTDVMIASYLLEANYAHPLEDLAIEHIGYKAFSEEEVCGRGAKAVSFADIPVGRALDYAGERADLALQLSTTLQALLKKDELQRVYDELEQPLIPVLVAIERAGVRIDTAALGAQAERVDQELSRLAATIFELAGEEFNINSPKKLSEILFDRLGMRTETIRRTTKTKAQSTAFEVLEELALTHELPKLILEWRSLQKLKGTYIDALPALVQSRHRPRAHLLQPGSGRDRPPEQQRPEPSEHSHPDRHRPGNSARLRRRAWPCAHLGRLLADRVACPRSPRG